MNLRQFIYLGIFETSYIRIETVEGATTYALRAADGSLLFRTENRDTARVLAQELNVALHPLH